MPLNVVGVTKCTSSTPVYFNIYLFVHVISPDIIIINSLHPSVQTDSGLVIDTEIMHQNAGDIYV